MSGPPLPDMDDGSSDGSYTSDSDGERLDLNTDLIGVRRATKDLNIVNRYRPHWGCSEAFREAYQNWCVLSLLFLLYLPRSNYVQEGWHLEII